MRGLGNRLRAVMIIPGTHLGPCPGNWSNNGPIPPGDKAIGDVINFLSREMEKILPFLISG